MENWNKEKVTPKKKTGLLQRLLSLAAAAALALSLVGCGTSAVVPGGSADVVAQPFLYGQPAWMPRSRCTSSTWGRR